MLPAIQLNLTTEPAPKSISAGDIFNKSLSNAEGQFTKTYPLILVITNQKERVVPRFGDLRQQFHLLFAEDGEAGIALAQKYLPDVIVSEIFIPKKNGFEVCETLRRSPRTNFISLLLITSPYRSDDHITCLQRGADAYLDEPFDLLELKIWIDKLTVQSDLRAQARGIEPRARPVFVGILNPDSSLEQEFIKQIQAIVESRLDDPSLSVPDLCRATNMSYARLHQRLNALTNKSGNSFIRQIRLRRACSLLGTTNLSVSEIAYEVGFKDPKYFGRVFVKELGSTPTNFRQNRFHIIP